jgi:hypothetical protein
MTHRAAKHEHESTCALSARVHLRVSERNKATRFDE